MEQVNMDVDDEGQSQYGTLQKFKPTPGSDSMMKAGSTKIVNTKAQSITVMKHYSEKIFEELRCEDYYLAFQFNVPVNSLRTVAKLMGMNDEEDANNQVFDRFISISLMKEYEHYSFEELRYRCQNCDQGTQNDQRRFEPFEIGEERYHSINLMKEYTNKSFEEIRFENQNCDKLKHSGRRYEPVEMGKVNMKPSRTVNMDDPIESIYRVAESHFYRQSKTSVKIQSIDIVRNSNFDAAFEKKQREFEQKKIPHEFIFAYHGTQEDLIDSILENNFDVKKAKRQLYGLGMYFTEYPDIALKYSDKKKQLILCKILPGRQYKGEEKFVSQEQYDSKLVNPDENDVSEMVIIQNSEQIVPYCVINLK